MHVIERAHLWGMFSVPGIYTFVSVLQHWSAAVVVSQALRRGSAIEGMDQPQLVLTWTQACSKI